MKAKQIIPILLISNLLLTILFFSKPEIKYLVLEESTLGLIPRSLAPQKYTLEAELESFARVFIFKRYNFTPKNALEQIESSFKLSSKRVQDTILENIKKNSLIKEIKKMKISQIFTPKNFSWARQKRTIKLIVTGERILTRGNKIETRENIKLSFLIRVKERSELNPYRFYIDGINEEVVN